MLKWALTPKNELNGKSKTFRLKNFIYVGQAIIRLFWEIRIVGAFKQTSHYAETSVETEQVLG